MARTTRPVPPALRTYIACRGGDEIRRFDEENESVQIGVSATFYHDGVVSIRTRSVPDGWRLVSVNVGPAPHCRDGDVRTVVQFRPDEEI